MSVTHLSEVTDAGVYEQLARLGKALSNPVRLRMLDLLEQGEHSVEELASSAQQSIKNTSAQLQVLRAAQLVEFRRNGTKIFYRLADRRVSKFLGEFESFAEHTLAQMRTELDDLYRQPGGTPRVSVKDFKQRMRDDNTIIIDVRPPNDYARGHIPGAISIPVNELHQRLGDIDLSRDVIAYCEGPYCFASAEAVAVLEKAGFSVTRIDGGLTRWVRAGGRLEAA